MTSLVHNDSVNAAAALAAAAIVGALAAVQPVMAIGLIGLLVVTVLPFLYPVAHFITLLAILALVPFGVQNQFGIGGGTAAVGLVVSDLLLAAGLLRALVVLSRARLSHGQLVAMLLTLLFLAAVIVQLVHGIGRGARVNEAGVEARTMLGYGVLLIALPILRDAPQRRRLLRALVVTGLLVGLWGVAQWTLSISYGEGGNFGVRQGVRLTSGGRGQLLGGLFSFPIVMIMGFAVLLSGHVGRRRDQIVLVVMVLLNGVCLLLTYERTFWLVTVLGLVLVALRAGSSVRWRAALLAPAIAALVLVPVAAFSPDTFTTARERLVSVGQYSSDRSVYYRLVESRHVLAEIERRPLAGSGLGASIWWGRPLYQIPADRYTFVHNGYLYTVWKLGIVVGGALIAALLLGVVRSSRRIEPASWRAIVVGSQASLAALLVSNLTFPSLSSLSATGTIGLLLAICLAAPAATVRHRAPQAEGRDSNPRSALTGSGFKTSAFDRSATLWRDGRRRR